VCTAEVGVGDGNSYECLIATVPKDGASIRLVTRQRTSGGTATAFDAAVNLICRGPK
jgi:hypothetical protein